MDAKFIQIIFLMSLGLLLPLTGCLELPESHDETASQQPDFGPEVSSEEVIRAFEEVAATPHTGLPEAGQFVYFEVTQQILGSSKTLIGELLQSIDNIEALDSFSRYHGTHITKSLTDEGWETDKSTFHFDVDQSTSLTMIQDLAQPLSSHFFMNKNFASFSAEVKSTFHHLSTQHRSVDSPTKPKDSENCIEVPHCTVNISEIRFDIVYWTNPPQKYSYYISYSPDIPQYVIFTKDGMMLDHKLETCITTAVDTTSGKIMVAQCETLKDFQFRYPSIHRQRR